MKETKAFRVLSDETKMRVLNLLLERECCVCEVAQRFKQPQIHHAIQVFQRRPPRLCVTSKLYPKN